MAQYAPFESLKAKQELWRRLKKGCQLVMVRKSTSRSGEEWRRPWSPERDLQRLVSRAWRPRKRKRASNRVARARQTVYGRGYAVSDALRLA